jgi:cell division transport system permease protein
MSISLYLNEKYDKNSKEVIDLIEKLKKKSPESNINYKSKDELLDEIKKQDLELVKILEKKNPLPNTITINNIPLTDYEKINYIIEWKLYLFSWNELDVKQNVFSSYKSQYDRITWVIQNLKSLWVGVYVIIAIFVFAIQIITYSIIWNFVYYYREEIYITKLVWWSKSFIYWPFSLQWGIYSMIAFLISITLFYLFIKLWLPKLFWIDYSLDFVFLNWKIIFPLELLLFVTIWALSWYFSSKKYLK